MTSTLQRSGTPELLDLHPAAADMRQLVIEGLSQTPKQLPAWFLYDAEGSRLFDLICQQPEYSLTCLIYTSPSPRDKRQSRMPSSA